MFKQNVADTEVCKCHIFLTDSVVNRVHERSCRKSRAVVAYIGVTHEMILLSKQAMQQHVLMCV